MATTWRKQRCQTRASNSSTPTGKGPVQRGTEEQLGCPHRGGQEPVCRPSVRNRRRLRRHPDCCDATHTDGSSEPSEVEPCGNGQIEHPLESYQHTSGEPD